MASSSLMLIHIGPVQDFIASARRCQDLWFGSYLLSELARAVADALAGDLDGEAQALVFPGSMDDQHNVANKIMARVPAGSERERAEGARQGMQRRLLEMRDWVLDRVTRRAQKAELDQYLLRTVAEQQIAEMMELYWVAVPCPEHAGPAYQQARARAEQLLSARKLTRSWSQPAWADTVPKSSLDGLRESVLNDKLFDAIRKNPALAERARQCFGVGKAERLCGVGLFKRMGERLASEADEPGEVFRRRPVFHSTSHMACAPLFAHFERDEVRQAFARYAQALGEGALADHRLRSGSLLGLVGDTGPKARVYDGRLLFPARLGSDDLIGVADEPGAARALRELLKTLGTREPPAYYALVMADGDRMGELIDAQRSLRDHQTLSQALDGFARGAADLIGRHGGSLIYSGGDDVLAMLPLHRLLDGLRALRQDFVTRLQGFGRADGSGPSLSAGVVIAHHMASFGEARQQAHRAERLAKRSRNALCIIFDKRSGGERVIWGSFDPPSQNLAAIDARLRAWMGLFDRVEVSTRLIGELRGVARLAEHASDDGVLDELLLAELSRVLDRRQPGAGSEVGLDDQTERLLRAYVSERGKGVSAATRIGSLANELHVALELYRVRRLCAGEPTPGGEA